MFIHLPQANQLREDSRIFLLSRSRTVQFLYTIRSSYYDAWRHHNGRFYYVQGMTCFKIISKSTVYNLEAKASPSLPRFSGADGCVTAAFFIASFSSLDPPSRKAPTTCAASEEFCSCLKLADGQGNV